jgi:murein DD-endopeptidase MepM/ murein hydrolase activator NlpD
MHSLSNERRQASKLRRRQVRRRRIVAIGVVVPLIICAIWAAYAWPAPKPARVPDAAVISQFHQASSVDRRVVMARLEGADLLLPVRLEASTAVAFHPVDNANSVAFTPVGEPGDASSVSSTLGDIFSGGGGMRYFMMGGDGSDASSRTGGLDVGAVPGAFVYSPVDGRVVSVKDYKLLGRYDDTEIKIQLADDPSLLLVVTHVARAQVRIGATVSAGETALGAVRGFPASLDQQLHQFTTDAGDHVQLVAIRVPTQLSGF